MVPATITRKLDAVLNEQGTLFSCHYCRRDFEVVLKGLHKAPTSAKPSYFAKLYSMFDKCGISYDKHRDADYYAGLVQNSPLPTEKNMTDRMLAELFRKFREYPSPETYMQRMVDRLSDPADGWEQDTLRLRILKQFMKYGGYLTAAGYGGRKAIREYAAARFFGGELPKKDADEAILEHLDDNVFSLLDDAEAEDKKAKGKYGLLRTADDLAGGKFRSGGGTKKALYLLAMVYGMTFCRDEVTLLDYASDIEKNLFTDYYNNNLLRVLSPEYRDNPTAFEDEPSGQGINYKNFAEVICLYYLCRQELSPKEKIKNAFKLIEKLQTKTPVSLAEKLGTDTRHYAFIDVVLDGSEADLEAFLTDHYDRCTTIPVEVPGKKPTNAVVSPFALGADQQCAFRQYTALQEKLRAMHVDVDMCYFGVFADRHLSEQILSQLAPGADAGEIAAFLDLLGAADHFLLGKNVQAAEDMTRTRLLSLFQQYYYAWFVSPENRVFQHYNLSFADFYKDFTGRCNPILTQALYPALSAKNFFDLLLVLSTYHNVTAS